MALAIIGLLITGWLQQHVIQYFQIALDYHYIVAYALTFALGLRLVLLVSASGSATSWHDLVPDRDSFKKSLAMLRFYVSFGRTRLPRWYAHSPLQIISGILIGSGQHTLLVNLHRLHDLNSSIIAVFSVTHIISVFLHDLKAGSSDISGMIHGYRIFNIEKPESPATIHTVSLDKLKQSKPD